MTNPDVLMNFVLDQSSSMHGIRNATVEGFNSFIEDQRNQPGTAYCSLTLFSTVFDARFVARDLNEFPALGTAGNAYGPSGMTALLDAVGTTIKGTEEWLAKHPEFTGKVVCVVLTDGEENSSRIWHINHPTEPGDNFDLAGLIDYKQKEGWEFIFLGSGGSAWLEQQFGHVVAAANFTGYTNDDHSNRQVYAAASAALTNTRSKGTKFAVDPSLVDSAEQSWTDVSSNT